MNLQSEPSTEGNVLTGLSNAAKRDLIAAELRKDAGRSDREIARTVGHGIDHKTVAATRERLGIATPLGNSQPTATERRSMLIAGAEDFNRRYPPGPGELSTAEEQVDEAIANGKVSIASDEEMVTVEFPDGNVLMPRYQAKAVQAAMDQCAGTQLRKRKLRLAEADAAGEKNKERTILARREEVTIQHDSERDEWILKQRRWPDEDAVIVISDADIHEFVDVLTDHLGYGRAP